MTDDIRNPAESESPQPASETPAQPAPAEESNREASPVAESENREAPASAKSAARKEEDNAFPFSVTVGQVYDGPLDLLLDLVRKQNIDIYDIPIAKITAQFLAYVEHLKASDVDTAGEFIYMSALLIHIKSKMLLPRSPAETADGEAEDPRHELVNRLLEHERFRNAAQMLQQKRQLEEATWTNPGIREFQKAGEDDQDIAADTLDLVRVFREILERARNRPILDVSEDTMTVRQMIDFVRRRLMMEDRPVGLSKLLSNARSVQAVVAMFLAMLELVRLQAVLLRQDREFSEIYIKKNTDFEQIVTDHLNVQDDWR
ncbi:MAG TPA: segregation/condensation protein A [Acidobacteriaceae bacterium]|nr:segregation/condensation protein A [Acidobacteriaceae bacterium]